MNFGRKLERKIARRGLDPLIYMIPTPNLFHLRTITQKDLKSALNLMKTSKSAGPDKNSTKLLKEAGDSIVESLVYILNLLLETGTFLEDWKVACVSHIYKVGSRSNCRNYRPIPVILVVAKFIEKIFHNQLSSFQETNEISISQQSGFRESTRQRLHFFNLQTIWILVLSMVFYFLL